MGALVDDSLGQGGVMRRRHRRVPPPMSSFAGFRFPREVIVLAVRWYLRYGLSYRDVEELLVERGIEVDQVTHVIGGPVGVANVGQRQGRGQPAGKDAVGVLP
jgi:hypothetical protein